MLIRILSILLISVMLISCSSKKKEDEKILPAEEIYNNSMDFLGKKKYKKAVEGFEDLERTYPYSTWAIKSKIMAAYTNYKNEEYTDAIVNLDKFISLHPGNKDISYAYYLKAICYYEQISDITRDQSYTMTARNALKEVIARFPTSEYARDAQAKLDLVNDHLAGKEVEVGRFYLKKKKYIAAINRFKEVVDKYQTTAHTAEALHRLVEANMALGLKEEAKKYASVLGYNYPGSKWYVYSYELIEGKKPDISTLDGQIDNVVGFIKDPFKKLRKQPNLVESIDKKVDDVGDTEKPVKVLPLEIKKNDKKKNKEQAVKPVIIDTRDVQKQRPGLLNWFRNLKLPFSSGKDENEPILQGN